MPPQNSPTTIDHISTAILRRCIHSGWRRKKSFPSRPRGERSGLIPYQHEAKSSNVHHKTDLFRQGTRLEATIVVISNSAAARYGKPPERYLKIT